MKILNIIILSLFTLQTTSFANMLQKNNAYYKQGQEFLKKKLQIKRNTYTAKNVILLIADGNGITSNYISRIFTGQLKGMVGEEYVQAHETFPYTGLVKTYNTDMQTPDSAGTGTAFHSGVRTFAGSINIDNSIKRGECKKTESALITPPSKIFSDMKKSVGVVSTARLTHATPATAYANAVDRNYENNEDVPKNCNAPDIATQLIKSLEQGTVDVAFGGGARNFVSNNSQVHGKKGKRTDGKNLILEAKYRGVKYVDDKKGLQNISIINIEKSPVLGLFNSSHMSYDNDRIDDKNNNEPSLADMSEKAISLLETNQRGYFLTIESGRIDHALHDNNAYRAAQEGRAFAEAVQRVIDKVDLSETLVIVTTDHSHGIALSSGCALNSDIMGLCKDLNGLNKKDENGKPFTSIIFATGSSDVVYKERPALTESQVKNKNYKQESLIPTKYEQHSAEDVAVYAIGPWSHLLAGTIEQNYISLVMQYAVSPK